MKKVITTFLVSLIFSVFAQEQLSTSVLAYKVDADGTLTPATSALPGQMVQYVIKVRNNSRTALPEETVVINGPFPGSTEYIPASAAQPPGVIVEEAPDGIKWIVQNAMQPSEAIEVSYRVYVKDFEVRRDAGIVRYEVSLPSDCTGNVTMSVRGSTEQHTVLDGWTHEYVAGPGDFLYLSVQNSCSYGNVSSTIYVNDEVEDRASASGAYNIASATSSY